MKTIIKIRNSRLLLLVLITISIFSCKKSDKLTLQDNYLGGEVSGKTALDTALYNLLVKPYNIEVRYKWDQSQFDMQYTIVPPRADKVLPAMTTLKQVWIDPYNEVTGSDLFMKTYTPKQLILAGSPILLKDGNALNGLAEGGLDILLSDINSTDPKDVSKVSNLAHLIHHEFTHILNQKKNYTTDFNLVTPSDYSATWYLSTVNPLSLGFISGYARKEPVEDFAEMVSWMLIWGKDGYENYINQGAAAPNPDFSDGIAKLRKKEAIVVAYFKSAYNIDFYSLQADVQKSLASATK